MADRLEREVSERIIAAFAERPPRDLEEDVRRAVRNPSPSRRRISTRVVTVLVGATAIAAVVMVGLSFLGRGENAIVQSAIAAVTHEGVLHVRAEQYQGESETPSADGESWVDVARRRARSHMILNPGTDNETSSDTMRRGGLTLRVSRGRGLEPSVQELQDWRPFRDALSDEVSQYRRTLESGSADVVGKENIGGIETWRIESTEPTRPPLGGPASLYHVVANVAVTDYRPIRIVNEYLDPNAGSAPAVTMRFTRKFETFEYLDERSVDTSLFDLQPPKGVPVWRSRLMRPQDARSFKVLPVMWLGDRFEGRTLADGQFEYSEQPLGSGARPPGRSDPSRTLRAAYFPSDGKSAPVVVTVVPKVERRLWEAAFADFQQKPTRVRLWIDVDGAKALQIAHSAEDMSTSLIVEREGATVVLQGGTSEQLLRAAKVLHRLR